MNRMASVILGAFVAVLPVFRAPVAVARLQETDPEYAMQQVYEQQMAELHREANRGRGPARPYDVPDIFGPGAVLNVGNYHMKITNLAGIGNISPATSNDPSGQWPGVSGIEYFAFGLLSVGGVNPLATDPNAVRRVSYFSEWRPASLAPEDKIYRAYDGIVNGQRFVNDDNDLDPLTGDQRIDEDFLDGRDNDGDGLIDEDYGAIGQQMFSFVMRDDTPQAINAAFAERHVPLGLEMRQLSWAYSIPSYQDFNVHQLEVFNRSGHELDSLYFGIRVDLDCGPVEDSNYFGDDLDAPQFPYGDFQIQTNPLADRRYQPPNDRRDVAGVSPDSALCSNYHVRVLGYSVADDDADGNRTVGVSHVTLIDHTTDPLFGIAGPPKVGFRMFRSHTAGTPYVQGGNPAIDQQRYEMMSSRENVDPETGWITAVPAEQKGDFQSWFSVGPFLRLANNGKISLTFSTGVRRGSVDLARGYPSDYLRYQAYVAGAAGGISGPDLLNKYPVLDNALSAQVAFEGQYELRPEWPLLTTDHGFETPLKAPLGTVVQIAQLLPNQPCEDRNRLPRTVTDRLYEWFDADCDLCTGAYSVRDGGMFHRIWLAEAPPPNPNTNVAGSFNYTDNPQRTSDLVPEGDGSITIAWDNLSETTPDPKESNFDFRSYRIWKVSDWTRPVGSTGPSEADWTLLDEFNLFDQHRDNRVYIGPGADLSIRSAADTCQSAVDGDSCYRWPRVYIPQKGDSQMVALRAGDLWSRQSGLIIRPDRSLRCAGYPNCRLTTAEAAFAPVPVTRALMPIGLYRYVDTEVKNGFTYFYSVTGSDSTRSGQLTGRRAAVESDGVSPQASANDGKGVWVVPNPYRGTRLLSDRPSAWDLTPNQTDPTGTHLDFFGLPRGRWTIRIYTVSGDLVAELRSDDGVNDSVRSDITTDDGVTRSGVTRQQNSANDGQARWNLISRNGQDIVSGIYMFTVDSDQGVERGKFVVIR